MLTLGKLNFQNFTNDILGILADLLHRIMDAVIKASIFKKKYTKPEKKKKLTLPLFFKGSHS